MILKFENGVVTATRTFTAPSNPLGTTAIKIWVSNDGKRSNVLTGEIVINNISSVGKEKWRSWTPLPDDIKIIRPGSGIPPEIAKLSGIWQGTWTNTGGTDARYTGLYGRQTTVIVEQIESSAEKIEADLIYSVSSFGQSFGYWQRSKALMEDA